MMVVLGSGLRLTRSKWELPGEQNAERGTYQHRGGAQSVWYCIRAGVPGLEFVYVCKGVWRVRMVHQGPGARKTSRLFSHLWMPTYPNTTPSLIPVTVRP